MDLSVKLRDKLVKSSFEGFHWSFLLALNIADNVGKLRNLLHTFSKVISIFFLNLELEFSQCIIDLTEEVNTVTDVLEVLINICKMSILLNEFFNISDWLWKIGDGLSEPFLGLISALTDNFGYECLNLSYVVLWSRKKGGSGTLAVYLEKTDISHWRQVRAEEGMVEVEQLYSVCNGLDWVLQSLVDQDVEVDLLVSPIDLKQLMEPCEEGHHLVKGTFNDILYHSLLLSVIKVFANPWEGI